MDPLIGSILSSAIQQIVTALVMACVLVTTTAVGLLAKKGLAYLQVKLGSSQLDSLKGIAQLVVRSLEQNPVFKDLDPATKKEKAVLAISTWCEKNKVPVTYEFVDSLIEEAVQLMNSEIRKYISTEDLVPGLAPLN
jgi:hypothetical protein